MYNSSDVPSTSGFDFNNCAGVTFVIIPSVFDRMSLFEGSATFYVRWHNNIGRFHPDPVEELPVISVFSYVKKQVLEPLPLYFSNSSSGRYCVISDISSVYIEGIDSLTPIVGRISFS